MTTTFNSISPHMSHNITHAQFDVTSEWIIDSAHGLIKSKLLEYSSLNHKEKVINV